MTQKKLILTTGAGLWSGPAILPGDTSNVTFEIGEGKYGAFGSATDFDHEPDCLFKLQENAELIDISSTFDFGLISQGVDGYVNIISEIIGVWRFSERNFAAIPGQFLNCDVSGKYSVNLQAGQKIGIKITNNTNAPLTIVNNTVGVIVTT